MIGNIVNGKRIWGEAGCFQVFEDGTYQGPATYITEHDQVKIIESVKILGQFAPISATVHQLLAVALQTDYAAWRGASELEP